MAKRLPLTANKELKRIEELPTGDFLDLSGSGIVDAESIQSEKFVGNLEGEADVANALTNAENILDGTINPDRLSGEYDIDITGAAEKIVVKEADDNTSYYPTFVSGPGEQDILIDTNPGIVYNPNTNSLGINDSTPSEKLSVGGNVDVSGKVTALEYFGDGVNLTGIVTQIVPSIGINIQSTEEPGKGVVTIDAYKPVGKTIYVSQNGDDNNTGLAENHPKRTIKAAATVAVFGDTIKVFPGTYVEENPIILKKTVSVEGTELRNCIITAKYPYLDLFHVNNGCHITDISFIGPEMTDGAAIVALQPLEGVEIDRYFDAARLIRLNLDYIANEAVGFLTSTQYIGAGRSQITDPPFTIVNSSGIATDSVNCSDDIKSVLKCVIHDITRGGNLKSVEAGLSYYDDEFNLLHITGVDPNGYSVKNATIDTIKYATDISRAVVNNVTWGSTSVGTSISVTSASYNNETGITTITTLSNHGLLKGDAVKIVGLGFTCPSGPGIVTYPSGAFGYIFDVLKIPDNSLDKFEVVVGQSTLPHTYVPNTGTIQKYGNIQSNFSQVKDLGIQKDPLTGFNNGINGCANVISAIYSCVGIVTNIIGYGTSAFSVIGINTTYPGNAGKGFGSPIGVTSAIYDEESGKATITAPGLDVKRGELVELRDLNFSCTSGGPPSIQKFPSGFYGYQFYVNKINPNNSFEVFVGVSTLAHTYVGGGIVVNRSVGVTTASYNRTTGITTIKATGAAIKTGDLVKLRGLQFSCPDSPPNLIYPTGNEGFDFKVLDIVTDKPVAVSTATYNNITGIATITAPGISLQKNDIVELRNLEFTCPDSPPNLLYPTGKNGYRFKVLNVVGSTFTVDVGKSTIQHTYVTGGTAANKTKVTSDTFTIKVGTSTKEHNYVSGGIIFPPYSAGVGPIVQGPYVRNCTNFVANSIGMKIDGFAAEPGDTDDIGVTGTMSVDSYTQYNQGGIGVSITNGAYAQLVSIFTICNDIALFTGSGGQCDVTNSNSSFGRLGLVADGVGDKDSKSIYRYTGIVKEQALIEQDRITISGIGNYRPYDGQAIYFDELFYTVRTIVVDDPGSGYSEISPPNVIIDAPPEDASGVRAEASPNVENGKVVSIDVIASGSQYRFPPKVTIAPPPGGGVQAKARATIYPTYYTIESATLPSAGITTIVLSQNLNNTISKDSIAYFTRLSLQITSSHSFEWVGAGNDIFKAKPSLGGVVITDNEVVKLNGGEVVYTSTDQAGNFRIGDDIVINQITGTISGRAFSQSLLNTVTPLILGLSK